MSFDAAVTVLEAHMTAAGTAVGQFAIIGGEPGIPARDTIAWWYDGTGENPLIPETLTDHPYGDAITVRAFWPVSNRTAGPARRIELECRALARTLIARLEADRTLGDNLEVLTIGDADAGWLNIDNGWARIVTIPLVFGFTDDEPIAR